MALLSETCHHAQLRATLMVGKRLGSLVAMLALAILELNPLGAQNIEVPETVVPHLSDLQLETPVTPSGYQATMPPGMAVSPDVVTAGYEATCGACGGGGCDSCCLTCGPGVGNLGFWLRADYLLWYEQDRSLPALVTSSSGTPSADDIGVLGFPNTQILFGGGEVDDNALNGFRIEVGSWLDAGYNVGLMVRYFTTGDREIGFSADGDDFNFLARPFFNLAENDQDAFLLTVPNERQGSVNANFDGSADGWELLVRSCAQVGDNYRLDYVLGYRPL